MSARSQKAACLTPHLSPRVPQPRLHSFSWHRWREEERHGAPPSSGMPTTPGGAWRPRQPPRSHRLGRGGRRRALAPVCWANGRGAVGGSRGASCSPGSCGRGSCLGLLLRGWGQGSLAGEAPSSAPADAAEAPPNGCPGRAGGAGRLPGDRAQHRGAMALDGPGGPCPHKGPDKREAGGAGSQRSGDALWRWRKEPRKTQVPEKVRRQVLPWGLQEAHSPTHTVTAPLRPCHTPDPRL